MTYILQMTRSYLNYLNSLISKFIKKIERLRDVDSNSIVIGVSPIVIVS